MATQQTRTLGKLAVAPSVIVLFLWMIVPLAMTIYFSFLRYNLLDPDTTGFAGFSNYQYFLTDPAFFKAMRNSLILVGWVLAISVVFGTLLALLLDQPFFGQGIVRIMMIAPFLVMPRMRGEDLGQLLAQDLAPGADATVHVRIGAFGAEEN